MTTVEERMKILTMIQDGTITAEEGMRLLETIEEPQKTYRRPEPPCSSWQRQFTLCAHPGYGHGQRQVTGQCPSAHKCGLCRLKDGRALLARDRRPSICRN